MRTILFFAFLIAGCGERGGGNTSAPAPAPPSPAENEARNDGSGRQAEPGTLEIGPFRARYDPNELARTAAETEIPPDWDRSIAATMLIDADRISLMVREECMYGQRGEPRRCTPSSEAGLAFAMLDEPYEEARGRFTTPPPEEVRLAGRDGISWEIGVEGEGAEHILLPADGRSLLIVRRYRNRDNPDEAAVQAVLDSLAYEG